MRDFPLWLRMVLVSLFISFFECFQLHEVEFVALRSVERAVSVILRQLFLGGAEFA